MPENLQYSPTAELLQERIDAMEEYREELEGIEIPDEVNEPDDGEPEEDDFNKDTDYQDAYDLWQEQDQDYIEYIAALDDAFEEIQSIAPNI